MPSEPLLSQSQTRPALDGNPSTSSINSGGTESPPASPPQHGKQKGHKHVVHAGRMQKRVPSAKALQKLAKAHHNEGSHTDLKKLGKHSSSTTSLKKNSSNVSLKRNRSSADASKQPKTSQGQVKRPVSVHFEIGDQDDAWEEASSSTSPALSRSASRSAQSSAKPSANNSLPESPSQSPPAKIKEPSPNGTNDRSNVRHTADAKIITERLLQRTHSQNTTKMSLATATPGGHSPESMAKSQSSTLNGTPKLGSSKQDVVSRFVGDSGTPSENSPFLHNRKPEDLQPRAELVKRPKSMGNLTRAEKEDPEEEESALAPRPRKSSTPMHAYNPPQQSRTQQKLWLQRASSNIEPQQITPGVSMNSLTGIHGGLGGTSLIGAGYDGRDPRIKLQLERTGLEYLVVRRHQDPVGAALRRLNQLPGAHRNRRIPAQDSSKRGDAAGSGAGRYGLSQSLRETQSRGAKDKSSPLANAARSSFEGGQAGSQDDAGISSRRGDGDGVGAMLRSVWEKNFDLSNSGG